MNPKKITRWTPEFFILFLQYIDNLCRKKKYIDNPIMYGYDLWLYPLMTSLVGRYRRRIVSCRGPNHVRVLRISSVCIWLMMLLCLVGFMQPICSAQCRHRRAVPRGHRDQQCEVLTDSAAFPNRWSTSSCPSCRCKRSCAQACSHQAGTISGPACPSSST